MKAVLEVEPDLAKGHSPVPHCVMLPHLHLLKDVGQHQIQVCISNNETKEGGFKKIKPEQELLSSGADTPGDNRAQDTVPGRAVTPHLPPPPPWWQGQQLVLPPPPCHRSSYSCLGFYILPRSCWMGTASITDCLLFFTKPKSSGVSVQTTI